MHKTIQYVDDMRQMFDFEATALKPDGPRNRAEWARMMAGEMKKQGIALTREMAHGNGEAVPPRTNSHRDEVFTDPELAAVEASLDPSRLLLQSGADVASHGVGRCQLYPR